MAEATAAQKKKTQNAAIVENEQIPEKSALDEFKNLIKEAAIAPKKEPKQIEEEVSIPLVEEESVAERTARFLNDSKRRDEVFENIEAQRWNDPLRREGNEKFVTFKEMNDHYSKLLGRLQQQMASIGGGGEVKFRFLDDVVRSTMTSSNVNHILEYDAETGKVQFTTDIGPIQTLWFDPEHVDSRDDVGLLNWNKDDDTLNLHHPNGVTQQIGQELYAYVRNRTGSTITNGTVVRFDGAEQNGTARLLVAPFLANGNFPNLYGLGIATQDIEDGSDGFASVWGKIRGIDTSAWNVGDILYVSPANAGMMTNVKPTAPDNVMPIAAVLSKDSENGEIFVRPTIEQRNPYGSFSDNESHSALSANTAYAIPINTTEFSDGVIRDPDDTTKIVVDQSGLYNFQFSTQFVSTNSAAKKVYVWARKNEIDIPHSATILSVVGNGVYFVAAWNFVISMNANDNFQLMWATTDISVSITSPPATSFSPSIPSTLLTVTLVAQ